MTRRTDFLIIGSGIAGLRAAVHLASIGDVVLLTKANPEESNTGYAQGGIAAAVGGDDSPDLHFTDTMAAGDGLCAADAVRVLVTEGPRYVRELIAWGARVDRDDRGAIALAREAAHSVRRVLHADDATGRELSRALWARAMRLSRLEVHNHAQATQLIVEDGGCVGARYLVAGENGAASLAEVRARSVLLATGGAGQVFSDTTNPIVASGDGVALAWRAGARVCDMEFVQFHPTALNVPGAPRFLISEALRGEGGVLRNDAARDGHWLSVRLFGSRSNRDGIGASLELVADGRRQVRVRKTSAGYLSQDGPLLHFGLGDARGADLSVRWPGGRVQRVHVDAVDRVLEVEEG